MKQFKIFMSNIGYARGLNGCLKQNILQSYRYIYCPIKIQQQALTELKEVIDLFNPDIGCLIEIDSGSFNLAYYNQIEKILDKNYPYFDIENKYNKDSFLSRSPVLKGKSNAFFSKALIPYQKLSFSSGIKRLIYRIEIDNQLILFFAHFSLNKKVRSKQISEIGEIIKKENKNIILMGDFNIFGGFKELSPLLQDSNLHIMNDELIHTFAFHKWKYPLDICICSKEIVSFLELKVIDQPFSDHKALLLIISDIVAS